MCEIRDKMQVVCKELTHDWAKSTILFVEKVKTRENCVENSLSVVLRVKFRTAPYYIMHSVLMLDKENNDKIHCHWENRFVLQ